MAEYLIGIDVGTTNVKAGLFRTDGELAAQEMEGYETRVSGRLMAEQNPEDWWRAAACAVSRMMGEAFHIRKDKILGISVSSQAPSLVALGPDGKPLRDALIWMDRRADRELCEIAGKLGETRLREITGACPDGFYLLPKLYWFKKHEPQLFDKTACILQTNGYINYRLTGEKSYDVSHAGLSLCMDVNTGEFSKEIEEATGIDFVSLFPSIKKNADIIGTVGKEASRQTGIPQGTPVAAGTTDTIAALTSFGLSVPGEAAEITGTSTLAFFAHDKKVSDPGRLMRKDSPVSSIQTLLNAPVNATGASVKWFLQMSGMDKEAKPYETFTRQADAAKPGAEGVFYFPYLMGERGPLWNNYARGMFIGMSLNTTQGDLARSVLEGTSYALRHLCDEAFKLGVSPKNIRVSGGGAKNELWLRIKASVLNIPVLIPDARCGNAILGDALLAGYACGVYRDIGAAGREIVKIEKIIEPDTKWSAIYDKLYPYYRKMYRSLDQDLASLAETMDGLYEKEM